MSFKNSCLCKDPISTYGNGPMCWGLGCQLVIRVQGSSRVRPVIALSITAEKTEIGNCTTGKLRTELIDVCIQPSPSSVPAHCFLKSVVDLQKLCFMDALSAATGDARFHLKS